MKNVFHLNEVGATTVEALFDVGKLFDFREV